MIGGGCSVDCGKNACSAAPFARRVWGWGEPWGGGGVWEIYQKWGFAGIWKFKEGMRG